MGIHEANRVSALSTYFNKDSTGEVEFNRIVRLGRQIAEADICYISFVDHQNQYLKSVEGCDVARIIPRTESICEEVIQSRGPVIIEDLSTSDKPSHVNTYQRLKMISYVGVPILSPLGYALGTLSVFFEKKRLLSDRRMTALVDLSQIAFRELAIQKAARQGTSYAADQKLQMKGNIRPITHTHLKVLNSIHEGVISVNKNGVVNFVNPATESTLGRSASDLVGLPFAKGISKEMTERTGQVAECAVSSSLQDGHERIVRTATFCGNGDSDVRVEYIVAPLIIHSEVVGALVLFKKLTPKSVSNGVELVHAFRQVKRLKDQLSKVEPINSQFLLARTLKSNEPSALDEFDLLRLASKHNDLEADQIMRMLAITQDVIDGPAGAASMLNIDRDIVKSQMMRVRASAPEDRPQSRIDRWMS